MDNNILDVFDSEKFRKEGHDLVNLVADYLENLNSNYEKVKVLQHSSPENAFSDWEEFLNNDKKEPLISLFSKVLNEGIHLHHPRYMGHQINPPAPSAALGGFLNAFMNNGMAVYEMGIPGTSMEKAVIKWVANTFGFPQTAQGLLCNGGTLANLTALLTARACKAEFPIWETGNKSKMALMVSEEAHYCVERVVKIMGWGSEGIIKIPVDDHFRMKTDLLPQYLQDAKDKGLEVIAVVGSACSTATGSFDNLKEIGAFCAKNNLWFHVDGAHGAANAFSDKWSFLVEGIHLADSVIMDFHKMMLSPSLITAVVVKEGRNQFNTFAQHAHYLWENDDSLEWHNIAKRSFECTKSMLSLPVYTVIYQYGVQIFTSYINRVNELTQYFYLQLKDKENWEIPVKPATNIICFRLLSDKLNSNVEINNLNRYIRERIIEEGDFYIVQTVLRGKTYLRLSLTNPLTSEKDLISLISISEQLGSEFLLNFSDHV